MSEVISIFKDQYAFLSNFYPCEVEFDGQKYPTVEHAYQAAKTLDYGIRENIRHFRTPGEAKRIGKYVPIRPGWEELRIDIMRSLLIQKFAQDPFKQMLLMTGNALLIEGNNWGDYFWGICAGKGENYLGMLLMEIRADLGIQKV